jgi:hypothetical protein
MPKYNANFIADHHPVTLTIDTEIVLAHPDSASVGWANDPNVAALEAEIKAHPFCVKLKYRNIRLLSVVRVRA